MGRSVGATARAISAASVRSRAAMSAAEINGSNSTGIVMRSLNPMGRRTQVKRQVLLVIGYS
jgi:hypothetical protein